MDRFTQKTLSRRDMLRVASGAFAGAALFPFTPVEGRPDVTKPRATSGDTAVEPNWQERLTVTVGPKDADIVGVTNVAIQAAVDYVARFGGGTVRVLPGEYRMRNAVFLRSGVRLLGSGAESALVKEASVETTLDADSDWYDQEITLADPTAFRLGDGVCLRTENPHHGGEDVLKRTLIARTGNRFKLDRALRDNFWTEKKPTISTLFPLITAEETTDLCIENITLDGNKQNNALLDGNYAGCIWFQDCSRIIIRGVTARNYNGDGISFQICHDVIVEDCHCHDNANLGLHPGSGSQRPIIRRDVLERNGTGLFFCWGVKYGLAEKNTIRDNKIGLSIGHRDDENVIRDNDIAHNGDVGVLFRPERGRGYTARNNRIENNRIVDNGGENDAAVDVQGATESNTLAGNLIRETRGAASRIGIRLSAESRDIELVDNRIEGFATQLKRL